jgi:hypothetical protein
MFHERVFTADNVLLDRFRTIGQVILKAPLQVT